MVAALRATEGVYFSKIHIFQNFCGQGVYSLLPLFPTPANIENPIERK